MDFGLTGGKLLLILVIAVLIIGPERLPRYTESFAKMIKKVRAYFDTAKERVKSEVGEDFTDEDWRKLDPRQYDPRRIIREALFEDDVTASPVKPPQRPSNTTPLAVGELPPYDSEAT